jgi:hypothetical protein
MKFTMTSLVLFIAFSSELSLADNSVNYRYTGNSVGKQVCRAIVQDDVKKLEKVLRNHRQTLVYAYTFNDLASHSIAGSFKCNDVALLEFSQRVGAKEVLGYLSTGKGIVTEQVVSIGK